MQYELEKLISLQERTNELLEQCLKQNEYAVNSIKKNEVAQMKNNVLIDAGYQKFLIETRMTALYNEWKASGDTSDE